MASTTGLFRRNGHFYLRVLLPLHHPLRVTGRSRIVKSLGTSSPNEAKVRALETRLKILQNLDTSVHWEVADLPPTSRTKLRLVQSVKQEQDGHEEEQIYRRTNHWLPQTSRGWDAC